MVGVSGLIAISVWPREAQGMSDMHKMQIFTSFNYSLLIGIFLFVPAFTSGAISREREEGTYELLYTTLLPPSSIILAKIGSSAGYILLILASTLPIACLFNLIGGISFEMITQAYWVIFLTVVTASFVCLAQSMRAKSTAQSAVGGIVWMLLWYLAFPILMGLVWMLISHILREIGYIDRSFMRTSQEYVWMTMASLSPFFVLGAVVNPLGGIGGGLPFDPLILFTYFWLALTLLHFIYLGRKVRKPDLPTGEGRRLFFFKRAPINRVVRKVKRSIATKLFIHLGESGAFLFSNPVFQKEIKSEFFGKIWYRRLNFWILFIINCILLIFINLEFPGYEAKLGFPIYILLIALTAMLPSSCASSFPREIERGNLDLLRGTRLSLSQVLDGKALAGYYAVMGPFFATVAAWLVMGVFIFDSEKFARALIHIPMLMVFMFVAASFFIALSCLASAIFKKSLGAILGTYVTILALYLFLPIILGIMGFYRGSTEGTKILLAATNPYFALGNVIEGLDRRRSYGSDDSVEMYVAFLFGHGLAAILLYVIARNAIRSRLERDQ